MKVTILFRYPALFLSLAVLAVPGVSQAVVIGAFTANPDGTFTYAYTVNNSGGPFDIGAWSLDLEIAKPDWDQLDTLSGGSVSIPNAGWFAAPGIPISGQSAQDFISLDPASDVAAGSMLSGFSFTSRFAPGPASYHEFSGSGDAANGQTVGPSVASVPEGGVGIAPFVSIAALLCCGTRIQRVRASAIPLGQPSSTPQCI